MADEFNVDEFLSNDQQSADGGTLRKLLEEKIKELKVMTTAKEQAEKQLAERTLGDVWNELGVPAPIRGFYQGDKDPDAVKKWWEESKSFFNIQAGETQEQRNPAPTVEQQEQQAALQQVAQASSLGQDASSNGYDAFYAKAAEIQNQSATKNPAALDELFNLLGAPAGALTPPRA